ncbi:hypothetical protein NA57DRAFT_62191 [Rhizodiscina lignyota]|uniref:Transmembrane protein n=1 Tax=Rhizodiscina lignyota TaxID=1504668 RepID=A0A9P4M0U0_9PEZI|nr:hypothetical protein NA57DRAFT_62191 [Rhizodiscina lignyota]
MPQVVVPFALSFRSYLISILVIAAVMNLAFIAADPERRSWVWKRGCSWGKLMFGWICEQSPVSRASLSAWPSVRFAGTYRRLCQRRQRILAQINALQSTEISRGFSQYVSERFMSFRKVSGRSNMSSSPVNRDWRPKNVLSSFSEKRATEHVARLCVVDRFKENAETLLTSKIDWWPFRQGNRSCHATHMRLIWKWYGEFLSCDVPIEDALEYKRHCVRISTPSEDPLCSASSRLGRRSFFNFFPNQSFHPEASTSPEHSSSSVAPFALPDSTTSSSALSSTPASDTQMQPSGNLQIPNKAIYWCVDKPWSELSEISMSPIELKKTPTDAHLFRRLHKVYNTTRGRFGQLLSWKSCQGIEFIELCVNGHSNLRIVGVELGVLDERDHEHTYFVSKLGLGLPARNHDYEYKIARTSNGSPTSERVHMEIARRQIVHGMRYPDRIYDQETIGLIPKRSHHTAFLLGDDGWGIRAIQGWSLSKILTWLSVSAVTGIVFVALWLVFVSKTDLQDAFVPFLSPLSAMMILIAIPQFLRTG